VGLDLAKTIQELNSAASGQRREHDDRLQRIVVAVEAMRGASKDDVAQKFDRPAPRRRFLWAKPTDGLGAAYDPPATPSDFCVLSVDGSQIDVDRHMPMACALINIGSCVIRYGAQPTARLASQPRLLFGEGLYLSDPKNGAAEVPLEGPALGLKRSLEEMRAVKPLVEALPDDLPTLALLDGTLVLWGASGRESTPLLKAEILERGLVPVLDELREMSQKRPFALAAYVSYPASSEVVKTLRLHLCQHSGEECERAGCSNRRSSMSPCSLVNHLLDRELFLNLLRPGQRSGLFISQSLVIQDYKGHQIYFFYVHTGDEIGRVEVPEWVATDERLLSMAHALVLDQCHRGLGYPVAISEAHEQAVVSGSDRQRFNELVASLLSRQGLSAATSEKSRSKRTAWL